MINKKAKTETDQFLSYKFRHRKKLLVAIFIFSFLLGANTLKHSFTVDDELYYSGNKISQKGIAGIKDMFTKGSTSGFKETGNKDLYRPLVMLSFGIEKDVFNNNPHASHFIQIMLYACCCVLLYSLMNILFSSVHFLIPLLITLLFAAHPVHTEVIASVKSRDELFVFLFSMLTLRQLVLIKSESSPGKIATGLFFLFCALLSKESAAMMVAVIPLTLYFFSSLPSKKNLFITIFSSGIFLVYFLMRVHAVPFSTITLQPNLIDNTLMAATTSFQMLATNFVLLGMYLRLLFVPYPLSYDYSYNQVPIVEWGNLFALSSLVIYLAMFVYAIFNIKKKSPISFGILFFLFTLFLSSNLLIKIDATIGLRFLFTPALGFCIAIVFVIYRILKINPNADTPSGQQKNVIIAFSMLIGVFAILTINRNADWRDNYTLFSHDVEVCPNSTRIQSSLAFEWGIKAMKSSSYDVRNEWLKNAVIHYKRAVEIYPDHPDAYYNLGIAYYNLGEKDYAMKSYWKAAEVNPELKDPLKELGGIYYNDHRNDSALYYFKRVLVLDSADQKAIEIEKYLEGISK
ncbi:MAG: tetratricopeptide repeat protein [Bacteroidia bacterium]